MNVLPEPAFIVVRMKEKSGGCSKGDQLQWRGKGKIKNKESLRSCYGSKLFLLSVVKGAICKIGLPVKLILETNSIGGSISPK